MITSAAMLPISDSGAPHPRPLPRFGGVQPDTEKIEATSDPIRVRTAAVVRQAWLSPAQNSRRCGG